MTSLKKVSYLRETMMLNRLLMDRLYKRSLSTFEETKRTALQKGACDLLQYCKTERDLLNLFFEGAGREFCKRHNFPDIVTARKWRGKDTRVFVDEGRISITDKHEIALVGNTNALVHITDVNKVHKLTLLHGAKANIKIEPYCFVVIAHIGKGTAVTIAEKGKGAVIVDD